MFSTTSVHGPERAEARGDSTGAHGLDCPEARGDSTGAHGRDRAEARGDSTGVHDPDRAELVETPLLQFTVKVVDIPVVEQRQVSMVQTVQQNLVEDSTVAGLGQGRARDRCRCNNREDPSLQSIDEAMTSMSWRRGRSLLFGLFRRRKRFQSCESLRQRGVTDGIRAYW